MPHFEEYYGYPFLDELHNFFPDFLYNNGRFNSVRDVFSYMNTQMNQHFNLFASAQHRRRAPAAASRRAAAAVPYFDDMNYIDNRNNINNINNINHQNLYTPVGAAAPQRVGAGVNVQAAAAPAPRQAPATIFSTEYVIREPLSDAADIAGLAGLASLLIPNIQPRNLIDQLMQIPGFSDPVAVRPSAAQINAATTEGTGANSQGEVCAICQDDIIAGCMTRRINHCDHTFHRGCIDTWFAQNVHCPVCRHDIRQPAAAAAPSQTEDQTDDEEEENIVD